MSYHLLLIVMAFGQRADAATLKEIIEAVEANSTTLALSHEATVQSLAQRSQALAPMLPQVAAQGLYTVNELEIAFDPTTLFPAELAGIAAVSSDPVIIQPKTSLSASLATSQSLLNGANIYAYRASRAAYRAALHQYEASRRDMVVRAVTVAYGLKSARERVVFAQSAVDSADTQHEEIVARTAQGLLGRRDELRARLNASNAHTFLKTAEMDLANSEEAFSATTGLDPAIALELEIPMLNETDLDTVLKRASSHPLVLAAVAQSDAATLNRGRAWWALAPQLSASFALTYAENVAFSDETSFWVATVKGTMPLFTGGYGRAQIVESASIARVANLQRAESEKAVQKLIRVSVAAVEAARERLKQAEVGLDLSQELLDLARIGLQTGDMSETEVMEAEVALAQARLDVSLAQAEAAVASTRLNGLVQP